MIDPPRTLADFEPLPPAEAQVLRALRTGTIAKLGLRRPHDAEPRVRLRGAFLSFLARGGAGVPAGGAGLQIVGACISGRFDLSGSTAPMSVWFYRCLFLTAPRLDRAHVVGSASFADCALPGLRAEACRVDEHLSLGAGCQVDGEPRSWVPYRFEWNATLSLDRRGHERHAASMGVFRPSNFRAFAGTAALDI